MATTLAAEVTAVLDGGISDCEGIAFVPEALPLFVLDIVRSINNLARKSVQQQAMRWINNMKKRSARKSVDETTRILFF